MCVFMYMRLCVGLLCSDATGIPGCIFIHANGFIGGAQSYEAVLRLADLALKESV
jgi:uncharacterized UPF0160 family protein